MLTLQNGDILNITCAFQHKGEAYNTGRLYAAIGKRAVIGGFDEKLVNYITVAGILDDPDWTDYSVNLAIPIKNIGTIGLAPGSDYEVYVKMDNIPGAVLYWFGPENDINLEGGVPSIPTEFQNLSVSYAKA